MATKKNIGADVWLQLHDIIFLYAELGFQLMFL